MKQFFYKLIPPRATFPMDITETEGAIMQAHFDYWNDLVVKRKAIVYGPVADPKGIYGIAVMELKDETTAQYVAMNDPAISSNAGFTFELYQMTDAKVRQ
jgi:hypothetical protein